MRQPSPTTIQDFFDFFVGPQSHLLPHVLCHCSSQTDLREPDGPSFDNFVDEVEGKKTNVSAMPELKVLVK